MMSKVLAIVALLIAFAIVGTLDYNLQRAIECDNQGMSHDTTTDTCKER